MCQKLANFSSSAAHAAALEHVGGTATWWVVAQTTTQPVKCPRQQWTEDASRLVACHRVMRSKLAHVFFKFNSHSLPFSPSPSLLLFLSAFLLTLRQHPHVSHLRHALHARTRIYHALLPFDVFWLPRPQRPLLPGCGSSLRCKANAAHTQRSLSLNPHLQHTQQQQQSWSRVSD